MNRRRRLSALGTAPTIAASHHVLLIYPVTAAAESPSALRIIARTMSHAEGPLSSAWSALKIREGACSLEVIASMAIVKRDEEGAWFWSSPLRWCYFWVNPMTHYVNQCSTKDFFGSAFWVSTLLVRNWISDHWVDPQNSAS